jgi:RNA polymerase sigma factor (sigma-70 family)
VTKNLAINWIVSQQGRRRLATPVARLPAFDQRVFALHFWRGMRASEIAAQLRAEGREVRLLDVLDSLDRIFRQLSPGALWRLLTGWMRRQEPLPLLLEGDAATLPLPSAEPYPETQLLRREAETMLADALAGLPARDRLLVLLCYEDGLQVADAARLVGLSEGQARSRLRAARRYLRRRLGKADSAVGGDG